MTLSKTCIVGRRDVYSVCVCVCVCVSRMCVYMWVGARAWVRSYVRTVISTKCSSAFRSTCDCSRVMSIPSCCPSTSYFTSFFFSRLPSVVNDGICYARRFRFILTAHDLTRNHTNMMRQSLTQRLKGNQILHRRPSVSRIVCPVRT